MVIEPHPATEESFRENVVLPVGESEKTIAENVHFVTWCNLPPNVQYLRTFKQLKVACGEIATRRNKNKIAMIQKEFLMYESPHATFNYCVSPECVVTRGLIATRGGNHTAVTVAGTSTEYVPPEKDHFCELGYDD